MSKQLFAQTSIFQLLVHKISHLQSQHSQHRKSTHLQNTLSAFCQWWNIKPCFSALQFCSCCGCTVNSRFPTHCRLEFPICSLSQESVIVSMTSRFFPRITREAFILNYNSPTSLGSDVGYECEQQAPAKREIIKTCIVHHPVKLSVNCFVVLWRNTSNIYIYTHIYIYIYKAEYDDSDL